MPKMPGNAGGAGMGNFNREKTNPQIRPVINDRT
jgi:hypothetical protein